MDAPPTADIHLESFCSTWGRRPPRIPAPPAVPPPPPPAPEAAPATLGGRVRAARKRRGLTQGELADLVCRARSTLKAIELDGYAPGHGLLEALALHLGVAEAWLLGGGPCR